MSQHIISTNQYEIFVGWDRPLLYFFGTVRQKSDGEIVFATLTMPEGGVGTVAELAHLLTPYIELPNSIRERLEGDRELNRGNAVYAWNLEDPQELSA
jgi:hypothetical protein